MSGGVPKRISISRTQSNTPSKAGNVMAKKAIVLCNGARSRRAMCNRVQTRAKYCPTPCVQKMKEGTTKFFTLKLGLDADGGPPDPGSVPGGTGTGFVGANVEFSYGAWDPPSLPGTQGLNTLASGGAPNPLGQVYENGNSICYEYDNDTGNNRFIIEAFIPGPSSTGIIPFTSITLTNPNNSQSITYNYDDFTTSNPSPVPLAGANQLVWETINDPNFQFWTDAYNSGAPTTTLNIVVNY